MPKAIFLDRDGVLNDEVMYAHKIEDFRLMPGVIEGLGMLKEAGFIFFIITNQSGIGRGYFTEKDMHAFNDHLLQVLEEGGITIEKIYFCPHHPEEKCDCRKPNPSSILDAEQQFGVDLSSSYVFGDHRQDMDLGKNAGVKRVFFMTGHGKEEYADDIKPEFVADDFVSAARWVIADDR